MSRGSKRALIGSLIGLGVIALIAVAGVVTIAFLNQSRDPALVVEEYLQHLEAGRAEAANEMVDHGYSGDEAEFLTDEVLAAATERIKVLSVTTEDRDGDRARITAELSLNGERFEHDFRVRQGPKEFLFLETWELRDPLVLTAELYSPNGSPEIALLGDVEVALEGNEFWRERHIALYPAVYEVTGPESAFFSTESVTMVVSPQEMWAEAYLEQQPTDEFSDEILRQVIVVTEECLTVPNNMEWECPILVQSSDLSEMFVVEPATHLDYLDMTTFESSWITIAVSYTDDDEDDEPISEDVYVRGDIEWNGDVPTIVDWIFY